MKKAVTRIVVVLLGALTALASIGTAVVGNFADDASGISTSIWPSHPAVLRETSMSGIGQAAARGVLPGSATMQLVRELANRAPLEPEPFLVEAALAEKRGDVGNAERLLLEARRRDPRSVAARYLLATLYLRKGEILFGLREMYVLTRFVPNGAEQVVPGLAVYAGDPAAVPMLHQLLREYPELERKLLWELAADASNADLILQLAAEQGRTPNGKAPKWQARLLKALVTARQYAKAASVWTQLTGIRTPTAGLYRPDFAETSAPPPFNWALATAGGGIADPVPGGGLHLLHYGRDKLVLARQLTVLRPGRYQLSMSVSGNVGADGQLRWFVRCLPAGNSVLELPLTRAASRVAGRFDVRPGQCGAHRIELVGMAQDAPSSSDTTISALQLGRVAG